MNRRISMGLAVVLGCVLAFGHDTKADVPNLVPVQGFLTDATGVPVDGAQSVTFAVYVADIGGTPVYSETQTISLDKGVMSAQIGRNSPLNLQVFQQNVQLYLGVTIGSGSELSPRFRLASAPYAAKAQFSDRATQADNGVPPGTIIAYAGTQVPSGWLACDGSIVDPTIQTQLAGLRAAIGDSWGDGGDLSGPKFALPDLRGRFMRGVDEGANNDPDVGARGASAPGSAQGGAVGSLQGSAIGSHSHGIYDPGHSHQFYEEGDGCTGEQGFPRQGPGSCVYARNTSVSGTGISVYAAGGSETRPLNVAVKYIIKY